MSNRVLTSPYQIWTSTLFYLHVACVYCINSPICNQSSIDPILDSSSIFRKRKNGILQTESCCKQLSKESSGEIEIFCLRSLRMRGQNVLRFHWADLVLYEKIVLYSTVGIKRRLYSVINVLLCGYQVLFRNPKLTTRNNHLCYTSRTKMLYLLRP